MNEVEFGINCGGINCAQPVSAIYSMKILGMTALVIYCHKVFKK